MVILARPVDSFHFLSPRGITTGDRDGGGDGDSTIKTFSSPSPSLFHPPSSSDLNSFVTFRSTSRRGSKMCSRKIVVLTVFIEKRLMMKTKYFARRSERVKRGTALSRDPPATWILFVSRRRYIKADDFRNRLGTSVGKTFLPTRSNRVVSFWKTIISPHGSIVEFRPKRASPFSPRLSNRDQRSTQFPAVFPGAVAGSGSPIERALLVIAVIVYTNNREIKRVLNRPPRRCNHIDSHLLAAVLQLFPRI